MNTLSDTDQNQRPKALPPVTRTTRENVVQHHELEGGGIISGILVGAITGGISAAFAAETAILTGILEGALAGGALGLLSEAFAPSAPSLGTGTFESSPTYGFDNVGTSFRPVGESLPLIYGEIRQSGYRIQAFTTQDSEEQYLHSLLAIGEGEITDVTDIEIENQPLDNFDDVQIDIRKGVSNQDPIPHLSDQVLQSNQTATIVSGSYFNYTTTNEVDEIRIGVIFPNGLGEIKGNGDLKSRTVDLDIEFKKSGSNTWKEWGEYESISSFNIKQVKSGSITFNESGTNDRRLTSKKDIRITGDSGTDSFNLGQIRTGGIPNFGSVVGIPTVAPIPSPILNSSSFSNVEVKEKSEIKGKTQEVKRKTLTITTEEKAVYDIRIQRVNAESSDTAILDQVDMNFVQERTFDDLSYDNIALLGMKIRATDQLNRTEPNVSFKVKGIKALDNVTPLTGTSGWTDNPMWCTWDALTRNKSRGGAGLDEGLLDAHFDTWEEQANYCDDQVSDGTNSGTHDRHNMDMVIDTKLRVPDFLQQVGNSVFGSFFVTSDGIKPVLEKSGTSAVHLFTEQDIHGDITWGYLGKDKRWNSIRGEYLDENENYSKVQEIVALSGTFSGEQLYPQKDVLMAGITRRAEAVRNMRHRLRNSDLETLTCDFRVPVDSVHVQPGDLSWVGHPTPTENWGDVSGKIHGFTNDYILLDQEYTFNSSGTYDVALIMDDRSLDELRVDLNETRTDEPTSIVHINDTFSNIGTDPAPRANYAIGDLNKNKKVVRILSISRDQDGYAQIQAVEHDSSKYAEIDDFNLDSRNLSAGLNETAPLPVDNLSVKEQVVTEEDGTTRSDLTVYWTPPDQEQIDEYRVTFDDDMNDSTQLWDEVARTKTVQYTFKDAPLNQKVGFRVQTVLDDGRILAFREAPEVTITPDGDESAPGSPTGISASGKTGLIEVTWDANTENDLREYFVYRDTDGTFAGATKIADTRTTKFVDSDVTGGTQYDYWVTAVDRTGNEGNQSSKASATPSVPSQDVTPSDPSEPSVSNKKVYQSSDGTTQSQFDVSTPSMPSNARYMNILVNRSGSSGWDVGGVDFNGNSTITVKNLTPGINYDVALQAVSQSGDKSSVIEDSSNPTTAAGDTTAPSAPTGLSVADKSGRNIEVNWTANSEDDLSHYKVYRAQVNNFSSGTAINDDVRDVRWTDTNFSTNDYTTQFFYWTTAVDYTGNESSESNTASGTLTRIGSSDVDRSNPSTPSAPTVGSGATYRTDDGTVRAKVEITPPSLPSDAETMSLLVRRDGSAEWQVAADGITSTNKIEVDDLSPGEAYDTAIQAFNFSGQTSGASSVTNFTAATKTSAPSTPTGLSVTDRTGRNMEVSWDQNTESDFDHYSVYRHTSNNFASGTKINDDQKGTQWVDTNFGTGDYGTQFFYWVTATDRSGNESSESTVDSGTLTKVGTGDVDRSSPSTPSAPTTSGGTTYQSDDGTTLAQVDITPPSLPADAENLSILFRRSGTNEWQTLADGVTGTNKITKSELIPGAAYITAARAFTFSDQVTTSTNNSFTAASDSTAPSAPTGLSAANKTGRAIFLSWDKNSEIDLNRYIVERDTGSGFGSPTVVGRPSGNKFTDTNFGSNDFGTTFYYRIKAEDYSGNISSASSSVSLSLTRESADINALNTTNGPAEAGADVTGNNTAQDTSNVNGITASDIAHVSGTNVKLTDGTTVDADNVPESATNKWAAESGADVTSNNTSQDTSNVNGITASDIAHVSGTNVKLTDGTTVNADNVPESSTNKWAAESGADVTGNNTANDVKVGGGRNVAESGADQTQNHADSIIFEQSGSPSNPQTGWLWRDTDDNNVYRYNGSSWVQIGSLDALNLNNAPAESGADVTANNLAFEQGTKSGTVAATSTIKDTIVLNNTYTKGGATVGPVILPSGDSAGTTFNGYETNNNNNITGIKTVVYNNESNSVTVTRKYSFVGIKV